MQALLTELNENLCILFFDEPKRINEGWYKVYHDGGHHVGTRVLPSKRKGKKKTRSREDIDELIDTLFSSAMRKGLGTKRKKNELINFMKTGIEKLYSDFNATNYYIQGKIDKKFHNLYVRKKRFKRKAYLNRWNYFVTFTYDDKKQTEESFRKELRKCLSNLHTRRRWRYMGIFENAPETERLHFHALMYIPDGEMIGSIYEKKDYNKKSGKITTTRINTFFEYGFGRNDFRPVNEKEITHGNTINYLLKYISKSGEKIVYSRGIPSEVCVKVKERDIAGEMFDYVEKVVLFDDVISRERDILNYKPRQLSMRGLFMSA